MDYGLDPDTGEKHISPVGLEHQVRQRNGLGKWYANVPMRHFIIAEHQKEFPELAAKMAKFPNRATNIYSAFLAMLPLQIKGKLTPELKKQILKAFNL